jgi:hypothetical protein
MSKDAPGSLELADKIYFSLLGDSFVAYRSHIRDYMERWILRTPWGNLRVHHILRSDNDRHLHDHPFDFISFLVSGGYREEIPDPEEPGYTVCEMWPRFSLVRRKATDRHRLILDKPVWTIVAATHKKREWGFYTKSGWIHWRHYGGLVSPEEGRALTAKYRDQDKEPRRSRSGWIGALQELNEGLVETKQMLQTHGDKIESAWERYKAWLRSL